jgi:CRP-like cAMP-binding protein
VPVADKQQTDSGVSTFSLARFGIFAGLPTAVLKSLQNAMDVRLVPAGAQLFAEGDAADCVYVIHRGIIRIIKHVDGTPVILARRGPGEIIGDMALLDGSTRFATAVCEVDTEVYLLREDRLAGLVGTLSPVALRLIKALISRLRATDMSWVKKLAAQERDFRSALQLRDQVLEISAHPIIITDDSTRIKLANPAARELFGTPDKRAGIWQWIKTEGHTLRRDAVHAAKEHTGWHGECTAKDIRGGSRIFKTVMVPTIGRGGKARECLWILQELTEVRALEQVVHQQDMLDSAASTAVKRELDKCFAALAEQRKLVSGCLPSRRALLIEESFTNIQRALEKVKALS